MQLAPQTPARPFIDAVQAATKQSAVPFEQAVEKALAQPAGVPIGWVKAGPLFPF